MIKSVAASLVQGTILAKIDNCSWHFEKAHGDARRLAAWA
jgi:hypothetical protein